MDWFSIVPVLRNCEPPPNEKQHGKFYAGNLHNRPYINLF